MLPSGDGDPLTALYPDGDGGARPAIAVAIDGNGRRVAADPYRGAVEAVLECSANLACVGAEPLGLTNCLNFGNPEKPHIAWQFTRAIAGLGDACRAFGIPVVGGNVSLYNEGGEARSTRRRSSAWSASCPTRGGPGGSGSSRRATRSRSSRAGWAPSPAASELSKLRGEAVAGPLPAVDLGVGQGAARRDPPGRPRRARCTPPTTSPRAASRSRWPSRASPRGLGASVSGLASEAELFGEGPGAFLVSGPADALAAFGGAARVIGDGRRRVGVDRGRTRRAARRPRPRVHLRPGRPAA